MTSVSRKSLDWLILIVVNLTVPLIVAWKHHAGEASQTVASVSGLVSLLVLNSVIIIAIHFREKRKNEVIPRGFVIGGIVLALFSVLLTVIGVYSIPEHNDYVELAFSSVPLDQIHPQQKALIVDLLRRTAANSRDYEHLAAQTKPISPHLYSVESFANENVIRSVLAEYVEANAADFAYHEQQEQTMNEFRDKMMKVDPNYLKSFEADRQEQETQEARAFQLQQECSTATTALYNYAETHAKDITVKDGQLRFTNDDVQAEFSRQLEGSKALYERWQGALQESVRRQQQSRKNVGVMPNS